MSSRSYVGHIEGVCSLDKARCILFTLLRVSKLLPGYKFKLVPRLVLLPDARLCSAWSLGTGLQFLSYFKVQQQQQLGFQYDVMSLLYRHCMVEQPTTSISSIRQQHVPESIPQKAACLQIHSCASAGAAAR